MNKISEKYNSYHRDYDILSYYISDILFKDEQLLNAVFVDNFHRMEDVDNVFYYVREYTIHFSVKAYYEHL